MGIDTLNLVIDALINYGFSELDAIFLVGRLIEEEAPHVLEYMSIQERLS